MKTATISLPSLSLPSISLPSISLPSISLPSSIRLLPSNQLNIARLILVSVFSLIFINTSSINNYISLVWDTIKTNKYFIHDMWEPFVAVCSFFVWIHGFYYAEKYLPIQQYRISKKTLVENADNDKNLTPWYSNWLQELIVYLAPLYLLSVHFDAFKFRRMGLLQAAPSVWRILREIMGGLFLYDFFFFLTHWPLHNLNSTVYKFTHHRHHSNKEVRAADTIKLTIVEEFVDVACSIAALRVLNAHPMSRTLYNIVIIGLLSELHCGYNFPLSPQNLVPGGIWAGSERHHKHHQNGKFYFQKFFTYLDNFFGFIEPTKSKQSALA